MPISSNFTSIFSKEWEINFNQCYPNGKLKLTELCNLIQLTAAAHSELGGLSYSDMQLHNQAWVLSRMRIEITDLPKWKDIITVKTWIISIHESRYIRGLEMYNGENKLVGCISFWAVMNTLLRKSEKIALPHSHYKLFPELTATKESFGKINFNRQTSLETERKVLLSDLDIVNHVNSVKYLEWCLDTVNPNHILNTEVKSMDLNYFRELTINDSVNINSDKNEQNSIYTITKKDKLCFALQLNWL